MLREKERNHGSPILSILITKNVCEALMYQDISACIISGAN